MEKKKRKKNKYLNIAKKFLNSRLKNIYIIKATNI